VLRRWFINLLGSVLVIATWDCFELSGSKNVSIINDKMWKPLGKNTLGIYMIQTFFFRYGMDFLGVNEGLNSLVKFCYIFVLSVSITLLSNAAVELIRKNKAASRVLLGSK